MSSLVRMWRNWRHGLKFAKKGKRCRFPHKYLEVDGHVELGKYCRFRNNVILRTRGEGKIVFGDRSGCSHYCIIESTKLVQIGNYTGIAEFTVIRDTNHLVYGTKEHWRYTPLIARPIIIGDSCLIGSRCYIMPGVTIGDGAVIQAGSIITKDVGSYEIWAGAPARKVAHRTENVPPSKQKLFEELVAQHGIGKDRYMDVSPSEPSESSDLLP
ncbi:MAG: acyltransferase [Candidatus Hydrogenedentota bacterium]